MSKKNRPPQPQKPAASQPQSAAQVVENQPFLEKYTTWLLAALAFVLYFNTLGHGFVLDDDLALKLHPHVPKGVNGFADILFGGYREGNFGGQLYRPMPLLTFAFEWALSPNNPSIHHFFNVVYYALTALALVAMLREWGGDFGKNFALVAGLLFVAHPIHTEVVANIKSRDEILCALGCIVAFWQWGKHLRTGATVSLVFAVLAYLGALLSKEGAVTFLPVFPLAAWALRGRPLGASLGKSALLLAPLAVYMLLRFKVFGSGTSALPDIMDNPIVAASGFGQRLATGFAILGKYLWMLVWPHPLSSDYSYQVIPLATFSSLPALLGFALNLGLAGFAAWGLWRRPNEKITWLAFCAAGYLMAISLYSQIPLVIGTMFGERLAYLPSLFFCLAAGAALIFAFEKMGNERLALGTSAAIVLIFSWLTMSRNGDWKSNYNLFLADSATYPSSVRLHNGASGEIYNRVVLDKELDEAGKQNLLAQAEKHLEQSLAIRKTPTAFLNLGNIRNYQKRYDEAIQNFKLSLNLFADYPDAHRNLALALRERARIVGQQENNPRGARTLLEESIQHNPNDAETWYLDGVSYGVLGDNATAAEKFEKAYALNGDPIYARNLSIAYANGGNPEKASFYDAKARAGGK